MNDRPHISFSSLDTHETCAERYRRRYLEGEKIPPGIAMLVGTGTDKGVQTNFSQKIESHADLPKPEIVEAAVAGFDTAVGEGYELTPDENGRGAGIVIGAAKDLVAKLAGLHAETQAPDYQPIAVQAPATISFPGATHDLIGYIDLIDDHEDVTDFKTAAKSKNQKDADNSLQLTTYAAARLCETGKIPPHVNLDSLIKLKTPKRQRLTSTRTMADFQMLINRINVMLASIKSGIFTPAPIGSWCCNPRWCGYFYGGTTGKPCPYVNHERRAAAEANGD